MNPMNGMRPVHPGEILAEELEELGLSANAFAKTLGVPTNRITGILNGQRGVAVRAERRLTILDNAESLGDLAALSSNRLERLVGDRRGDYSIRINQQWRVCFSWGERGPFDVEIVDYH